jgi:hypothetical protein
MPVPLFEHKPERCPFGHSLAPGTPQKISWLPCICEPAREAAERGRGMGHMTVWCGTCSAEDHRDATYYEPPHQVSHNRPLSGWVTKPDALASVASADGHALAVTALLPQVLQEVVLIFGRHTAEHAVPGDDPAHAFGHHLAFSPITGCFPW